MEDKADSPKDQADKSQIEVERDVLGADYQNEIINIGRLGNVNTGSGTRINVVGDFILHSQPNNEVHTEPRQKFWVTMPLHPAGRIQPERGGTGQASGSALPVCFTATNFQFP